MSKPLTVEEILQGATENGAEKTAAATEPQVSQDRLLESVTGVLSSVAGAGAEGEKTAAAPGLAAAAPAAPAEEPGVGAELLKMAADLAGAENAATIKEAQLFGAAMMDGAMARLAEWNQAAAATGTPEGEKTAADHDFEKFSAENPELIKAAAQRGYGDVKLGLGILNKEAEVSQAVYVKGYNDMAKVGRYIQQQAAAQG